MTIRVQREDFDPGRELGELTRGKHGVGGAVSFVGLVRGPDGEPVAERFPRQGSGVITSLVESDGLVELPETLTRLDAGAMVDFLPFETNL